MNEVYLNVFENRNAKSSSESLPLPELLSQIKNGGKSLLLINALRSYAKEDKQYDTLKAMLPAVTWNASFNGGRRKEDVAATTGYIYLDKDALMDSEISEYKQQLISLPYVVAVWRSAGGRGLGCLARVDNVSQDNFKQAWQELDEKIGIQFDPGVNKVSQINFLSYDPEIAINPNVTPYVFKEGDSATTVTTSDIQFTERKVEYRKRLYATVTEPEEYTQGIVIEGDKVQLAINKEQPYLYDYTAPFYSTPSQSNISFKTQLPGELYNGNDYAVFPSGINFLQVYSPKRIPFGKRHKTLAAFITNLVVLNPYARRASIAGIVNRVNNMSCEQPLGPKEINDLINFALDKRSKGKLYGQYSPRYLVFNPASKLTLAQKRRINGVETAKRRRHKTIDEIGWALEKLKLTGEKVTQSRVAELTNKSIRTIKTYWPLFKPGLKSDGPGS